MMENNCFLTPLKLAADRGSRLMVKHILRRRRQLAWYVALPPFPRSDLVSWTPETEKTNGD